MSDTFTLKLNGKRFEHWQRIGLRQSVDDLAASLTLELTQDGLRQDLDLNADTICELFINDALVTTVRADQVQRSVDEQSHRIQFSARSLGRELIDTQYSITLNNMQLHEIVNRLCTVFKVPLNAPKTSFIVKDFSMQCEAPANAILNAARAGNILIYPTFNGGLVMAEPDDNPPVTTLTYGQDIKGFVINDEYALRFSEYVVKNFDSQANTSRKGSSADDIGFFRPMHILADRHSDSIGALQRRAALERNRRLARAHSLRLTVVGAGYWQGGVFKRWQLNTQVRVLIAEEGIDDIMLLGEIEIGQDDQGGTITQLTMMHRNAFVGESHQTKHKSAGAA